MTGVGSRRACAVPQRSNIRGGETSIRRHLYSRSWHCSDWSFFRHRHDGWRNRRRTRRSYSHQDRRCHHRDAEVCCSSGPLGDNIFLTP